jgi:quinol monooxygenase YgiN
MITVGLLAKLKAKPGKNAELEALLKQAEGMAKSEQKTVVWFAFKGPDDTCYIFDAFADESGRKAHLDGPIAAALMKVAPDLLASPPDIQPVGLLASKVP